MLKSIKATAAVVLIAGAAQSAVAADLLPREFLNGLMSQCRGDYHRVCPDVLPGGGRVGRCLEDHQEQLSPGCLRAVKLAIAIKACAPDASRFCPQTPAGDGRLISCLADNMPRLAPECARIVNANLPYAFPRDGHYNGHAQAPTNGGYGYNGQSGYNGPNGYNSYNGYNGQNGYNGYDGYNGGAKGNDFHYDRYPSDYSQRDDRDPDDQVYNEGGDPEREFYLNERHPSDEPDHLAYNNKLK